MRKSEILSRYCSELVRGARLKPCIDSLLSQNLIILLKLFIIGYEGVNVSAFESSLAAASIAPELREVGFEGSQTSFNGVCACGSKSPCVLIHRC